MTNMLRVIVMGAMLAGCGYLVDEGEACRVATAQGFSACRVTDSHVVTSGLAGCAKEDAAGFDVAATNPRGQRVALLVCCGWPFKGCTVRVK